jgi:hypothetical protein
MGKMGILGKAKLLAALCLGFSYPAFGACQVIVSNYTLTSDVNDCFEIYGAYVVFDGNGHKIYGSSSQASDKVIAVRGYNTTVKNLEVDCNTKLTGIDVSRAGNSRVDGIRISNCTYGVRNSESGLDVSGILDHGSNMINNTFDVISSDQSSGHLYTYDLDGYHNGTGYGVYSAFTAYYDSYSLYYLKSIGMIASSNWYFWINHTQFFGNTNYDLYLINVANAYLTQVRQPIIRNSNSRVITD